MVCLNQTRPHCVNQMGKAQSKALAERHGRGTAWYVSVDLKLAIKSILVGVCHLNTNDRGFDPGQTASTFLSCAVKVRVAQLAHPPVKYV
jgi:acetamidase/formamidase